MLSTVPGGPAFRVPRGSVNSIPAQAAPGARGGTLPIPAQGNGALAPGAARDIVHTDASSVAPLGGGDGLPGTVKFTLALQYLRPQCRRGLDASASARAGGSHCVA